MKAEPKRVLSNEENDKLKFLDPEFLMDSVGSWNRYQAFQIVIFVFITICFTYGHYLPILYLYVPEHHCFIPGGEEWGMTQEEMKVIFIPKIQNSSSTFEKCLQYDVDSIHILRSGIRQNNFSWPITKCQNGWYYELDNHFNSVSTEFDFVCEHAWKGPLTDTVYFIGSAVGMILNGWIGDHYGRYWSILVCNWCGCISGICLGFAPNSIIYTILRFLMGIFTTASLTSTFVLSMEYVSKTKRTFVGNFSVGIGITVAGVAMPSLFYFFRDWRCVNHIMYAQVSISLLLTFFIDESIRWLLERGNFNKVCQILQKIAKFNGKKMNKDIIQHFNNFEMNIVDDYKESGKEVTSIWALFKTSRLRKNVIIMIILWSLVGILFETHVRNIQSLEIHIYFTFAISSFIELPADLLIIFAMEHFGRRWIVLFSMFFSGVPILVAIYFQAAGADALIPMVLTMIGRFCISICVNAVLQFHFEIIPTDLRVRGSGLILFIGEFMTFTAPYIIYSSKIYEFLPHLILGFGGVCFGVFALCLPETTGVDLPTNAEEGERFGMDQKFFYMPCLKNHKNKSQHSIL